MKKQPLKMWADCNPEEDDTVAFYTRMFGDSRVVIIPKNTYVLSETPTTFVLTEKNEN